MAARLRDPGYRLPLALPPRSQGAGPRPQGRDRSAPSAWPKDPPGGGQRLRCLPGTVAAALAPSAAVALYRAGCRGRFRRPRPCGGAAPMRPVQACPAAAVGTLGGAGAGASGRCPCAFRGAAPACGGGDFAGSTLRAGSPVCRITPDVTGSSFGASPVDPSQDGGGWLAVGPVDAPESRPGAAGVAGGAESPGARPTVSGAVRPRAPGRLPGPASDVGIAALPARTRDPWAGRSAGGAAGRPGVTGR